MKRPPVVAGLFYESNKEKLRKQLDFLFNRHEFGPKVIREDKKLVAGIVPHAGYVYSGAVASWLYSKLPKGNFVIIGPNHYGLGNVYSVYPKGSWVTPLGEIEIDEGVTEKITSLPFVKPDLSAFVNEHSIEVQLPFLQYRFGNDFRFVALDVINEYPNNFFLETAEQLAKVIANFVENGWKIVATTDFSHYAPQETAEKIDKTLIDNILNLNAKKLFLDIIKHDASICGFVPVAISIFLAKILGLEPVFYTYKTSGDITGDYSSVVGYASIGFREK
ncbi:MAG: AmmeMemoRadiSam system protein B [Candidatus Aenigmarchaeota archaeon]|nr:AmmeMemoRadiSam system protein B [Candidatus Aenigmarchaeota archaeon]